MAILRYCPFSNRPNVAAIVAQPFGVLRTMALMRVAAGSHSTKHHWLACWDFQPSLQFHVELFQRDLDVPVLLMITRNISCDSNLKWYLVTWPHLHQLLRQNPKTKYWFVWKRGRPPSVYFNGTNAGTAWHLEIAYLPISANLLIFQAHLWLPAPFQDG